jgi:hypothetical protein
VEDSPSAAPAAPPAEKNPVASTSAAEVREKLNDMIRQNLPELTKAPNEALKKEAENRAPKKQPQKENISTKAEKKAT